MLLLLSWYKFPDEKLQDSDAFHECITRQTDQPTIQPMDTAYCKQSMDKTRRVDFADHRYDA